MYFFVQLVFGLGSAGKKGKSQNMTKKPVLPVLLLDQLVEHKSVGSTRMRPAILKSAYIHIDTSALRVAWYLP